MYSVTYVYHGRKSQYLNLNAHTHTHLFNSQKSLRKITSVYVCVCVQHRTKPVLCSVESLLVAGTQRGARSDSLVSTSSRLSSVSYAFGNRANIAVNTICCAAKQTLHWQGQQRVYEKQCLRVFITTTSIINRFDILVREYIIYIEYRLYIIYIRSRVQQP